MFSSQVVEITKGSKVKYELDKKTGLIMVRAIMNSLSKLADDPTRATVLAHKVKVW